MRKVTLQSLNALFEHFNEQPGIVLWIRSLDYSRQLYLSQSFEKLWGVPTETLYNSPSTWQTFIEQEDLDRLIQRAKARLENPSQLDQDCSFYRIFDDKNRLHHMRCETFLLIDEQGTHIAYFGITREIAPLLWKEELNREQPINKELKNYIFNTLRNEARPNTLSLTDGQSSQKIAHPSSGILISNGRPVAVTAREAECLRHLSAGKSAKQTAALLNLSARTIEFHLNNLKEKAGCRTKLELLSKTVMTNIASKD